MSPVASAMAVKDRAPRIDRIDDGDRTIEDPDRRRSALGSRELAPAILAIHDSELSSNIWTTVAASFPGTHTTEGTTRHATHARREGLGTPRRPSRRGRARPALRRPASRPRGHEPAGVRGAPADGPLGPTSGPDGGHDGSQRAHDGRSRDRRDQRPPDGGAADQRRRVRHHAVSVGLGRPGHRARDRSRDGLHAAGHDDRVRRLAHLDARRVRRARVRHRHQRGGARAGHADAAADPSRSGWR